MKKLILILSLASGLSFASTTINSGASYTINADVFNGVGVPLPLIKPESATSIYLDVTLLKIKYESTHDEMRWDRISNFDTKSYNELMSMPNVSFTQTGLSTWDGESVGFAFTTNVSYIEELNESMIKGKKSLTMESASVEVGEKIYLTPTIMADHKIKINLDGSSISYIEKILKLDNGIQFPVVHNCNLKMITLPSISSGTRKLFPLCALTNYQYYILISPEIEKAKQ